MRAMKLLVVVGLVLCAGCAGLGGYAKERGNDFLDCFTLQAGLGGIAGFEVRATDYLATGAGAAGSLKWGLVGRHWRGPSADVQVGLPVLPLGQSLFDMGMEREGELWRFYTFCAARREEFELFAHDDRTTKSIGVFDVTSLKKYRFHAESSPWAPGHYSIVKEDRPPIQAFDLLVDATVLPASARFGFSPGRFADFVLGIFGLYIIWDDTGAQEPVATKGGVPCER